MPIIIHIFATNIGRLSKFCHRLFLLIACLQPSML